LTGDNSQLAGPRMFAKILQSYGAAILRNERARRVKRTAVALSSVDADKARGNAKTRIAIAVSDGLESSAAGDLVYGTVMHLVQNPALEIWLIVRSPLKAKQIEVEAEAPYDKSYPPAVELVRQLGKDHIIYIGSDHADDHLVIVGAPHLWNVILHVNGFNDMMFWRSLVMAQLAEVYLEWLSCASLLGNDMGSAVGAAHWTFTSSELASPLQLALHEREPVIFNPCIYTSEAWYQKLVLSWGEIPAPSGPPGMVFCGLCTRLTEASPTGGTALLHAILDIMHQAYVMVKSKVRFYIQGPTSKVIQIKASAREYRTDCNYAPELCNQIIQIPFWRDKKKLLRWLFDHPEVLAVAGEPISPHTGSVDAATAFGGTLIWATGEAEWPAKVPKTINNALGLGEELNTTTREAFTHRGVELMADVKRILEHKQFNRANMLEQSGFYGNNRFAVALMNTMPTLLNLARTDRSTAAGRLPDVDTEDHSRWRPSPLFRCASKLPARVDASLAMRVEDVLHLFAAKGAKFSGAYRAAAETALEIVLKIMSCDPLSIKRGGARITFQGMVTEPDTDGEKTRIGWYRNMRALVKFEYPREDGIATTKGNVHNSETIREGQNALAIRSILEKQGRMKHVVPELLELLAGKGRTFGAIGFVNVDLGKSSANSGQAPKKNEGLLIFMFCAVVPGCTDLHGDKIFKDVQRLWIDKGEISEDTRAIARNIVHAGAWMAEHAGLVNLDQSWGNAHLIPVAVTMPWLADEIRNRMSQVGNAGWCDTGGCIHIGTAGARKDGQTRPQAQAVVAPLCRNATQTAAPAAAKKPRLPGADEHGFGIVTTSILKTFADHRRENSAGNGRPTGGTPECTDQEMKKKFDAAGPDDLLKAESAIMWQSYSNGAIIFSLFVPLVPSASRKAYGRLLAEAAASPEAMLNCMTRQLKEGVTVKQPKLAALFANLIFNMVRKDVKERASDRRASLHPALTRLVFSEEVQKAVDGAGYLIPGRRGFPGTKFEGQESSAWLIKPDGPSGSWGAGGFAARNIKDGHFAGFYVGVAQTDCNGTSVHEYPPGIANVSLFDGTEPNLSAMGELPLDLLVELGGPGVFFNAKPSGHGANLRLERTLRVMDGGVMYIPFMAIHDIKEGDGGYWDYEPDKGLGGADSYHFNDSVWGIGQVSAKLSESEDASGGGT